MHNTVHQISQLIKDNKQCVVVTVAYIAGSAPREAGAQMIVTQDEIIGTIGGGNLEYKAEATARSYLTGPPGTNPTQFIELYGLGPELDQCCGGAVFLHYEYFSAKNESFATLSQAIEQDEAFVRVCRCNKTAGASVSEQMLINNNDVSGSLGETELDKLAVDYARQHLADQQDSDSVFLYPLNETPRSLPDVDDVLFFQLHRPADFHICVFGAGHVAKALVPLLANTLPCVIKWVDSRAEQFPTETPYNVEVCRTDSPVSEVERLSIGTYCLVMTHSHPLDQLLCEHILQQDTVPFLGLIGSDTKRKRFIKRFKENNVTELQLQKLCCPIGIGEIRSKTPAAIAVSVTAQLLQLYEASNKNHDKIVKAEAS